jgi:hypothetical protein
VQERERQPNTSCWTSVEHGSWWIRQAPGAGQERAAGRSRPAARRCRDRSRACPLRRGLDLLRLLETRGSKPSGFENRRDRVDFLRGATLPSWTTLRRAGDDHAYEAGGAVRHASPRAASHAARGHDPAISAHGCPAPGARHAAGAGPAAGAACRPSTAGGRRAPYAASHGLEIEQQLRASLGHDDGAQRNEKADPPPRVRRPGTPRCFVPAPHAPQQTAFP